MVMTTPTSLRLFPGGPHGPDPTRYLDLPGRGNYFLGVLVGDFNRDGWLDLLAPAYSTQFSRELPAHLYWGDGTSFDWENPLVIPCNASCAFMTVDITRNGYRDVLAVCHRDDLGHQVDSLLFWNGPEGLSLDRVARIPGMGPHLCSTRDFGNGHTREPVERYVSPPYALNGKYPTSIAWKAEVPDRTDLKFELRWAATDSELENEPWRGPKGEGTFYERPGTTVTGVDSGSAWLQYRATFHSPDGCRSPKLTCVDIELATR